MGFGVNPTAGELTEPNIDTRSSSGLLDIPDMRLAAAGVCVSTSVAARPDGCPSIDGSSPKSLRIISILTEAEGVD
jgi:hypothetical protein